MAVKTFVPALVHIAHRVCKYITKHHDTLADTLGPTNTVLLDALYTACNAFCTAVTAPAEEP